MLETYLSVLELGYYEAKCALEGLADENVWKRPAPGLLSVGEITAHIAYWEAVMLAGENGNPQPDLARCRVSGPLIDGRYASPSLTVTHPPAEPNLTLMAKQIWNELLRVHEQSVAYFKELNPDLASPAPSWSANQTYSWLLKYAAFHVSYHTGQIVTARHLLGDPAPDN